MEIEKLIKFNNWWETKRVKSGLLKPHKRALFFELLRYMKMRQILLIKGLRRVGKTTLIYQLIQDLLDSKVKETTIIYFSFDEESADFEDLLKTYTEKVLKKELEFEKIYIFLDEIQKCKEWQNKIKIYYDLYPNIKFIISGSASVQILKKAKESLAGRIFDFVLQPLSFREFLEWKGISIDIKKLELYRNRLQPLFNDYLRKGGFPEIVAEERDDVIKNYIKNNIIERVIFRDLPEEFGIKDYELLKILIELIATNPGMIINYDALSRNLKRSKKTIIDYFFYLEYALLINIVANYRAGFLVTSRKMRKAYLNNTALAFVFVDEFFSDKFLQKIAENFAVIETGAKHYYKNKQEVDMILKVSGKVLPIEVKYGIPNTVSMKKFLDEFKLKNAIILTKDVFDKKTINKRQLFFIPIWAWPFLKEKYVK